MFRRLFAWINRYERHLSVAAMIAGFTVDNFFFGRIDDLWNTQSVFIVYATVCFVSIPLLHYIEARGERTGRRPRWRGLLPLTTQFALGGFWSGFIIFYGRSATLDASWPFLLLLLFVFLGNEVLSKYHDRLVFTSVLFFFALYSYAIFALPIYTHTIDTVTFLESGVAAVLLFGLFTVLLRILGRERFSLDVFRIRIGAAAILLVMHLFYFTNVLPPLPLAEKAGGVYHAISREAGAYRATEEIPGPSWVSRYLRSAPTLHVVKGGSVYAYSSIFAPTALTAIIVHRWQWRDPAIGKWVTRFALTYPIEGGRGGGYVGYSAIIPQVEGRWRVSIETADGRVIARLPLTVEFVEEAPALQEVTLP
jgi:hypothetical protein